MNQDPMKYPTKQQKKLFNKIIRARKNNNLECFEDPDFCYLPDEGGGRFIVKNEKDKRRLKGLLKEIKM